MNALRTALLGFATISVFGCSEGERLPGRTKTAAASTPKTVLDTVRIAAGVAPVSWLACEIAGAPCLATTLVPPGASAHTFEPKPSLLSELGSTRLYFSSGLAFEEAWVPRLKSGLSGLEIVELKPAEPLPSQDGHDHGHGEESDPHFWSSPRAMLSVADSIAMALTRTWPSQAARISQGHDSVRARLLRLDTAVRNELAPYMGKHFYINHPELGYLAKDCGLVQEPLEEGGREPSLSFLLEARKVARVQGIRAVYVQGAYATRTAEGLAKELNVPVVQLDLYASPWDSAILRVARTLAQGL